MVKARITIDFYVSNSVNMRDEVVEVIKNPINDSECTFYDGAGCSWIIFDGVELIEDVRSDKSETETRERNRTINDFFSQNLEELSVRFK